MFPKFYAFSRNFAAIAILLTAAHATAQKAAENGPNEQEIKSVVVGEVPNLKQKGDTLYFAGQPSEEDLRLLRERGVATVINLRTQSEMDSLEYNEADAAKELGMKYVHVPVTGEGATPDAVDKVRQAIDASKANDQPVLIHCASANRVGYIWALILGEEGLAPEAAIAEGKAAGMRSPALEEDARKRLADDAAEQK